MDLAAKWMRALAEISLRAVGPRKVVAGLLETLERLQFRLPPERYALVALGKAAEGMVDAWMREAPTPGPWCGIAPIDYGPEGAPNWFGGEHPLPGPRSFRAGRKLAAFLQQLPPGMPLVVLMSGGASAAVEHLRDGYRTEEVMAATEALLADGAPIEVINPVRAQWSQLKAGGALRMAGARPVVLGVQSDVPKGQEAWVGSGPFDPGPFPADDRAETWFRRLFPQRVFRRLEPIERNTQTVRILMGDNEAILKTAAQIARREGLTSELYPEHICHDVQQAAGEVATLARTRAADLLLFGGEPTVTLCEQPGRGGRMGMLALAYGLEQWPQPPPPLLAVASDGADGHSRGAGAFWLPGPFDRALAEQALQQCDSDRFHRRHGRLLQLPHTQLNVRDLVMVLRRPDKVRGALA